MTHEASLVSVKDGKLPISAVSEFRADFMTHK